MVAMGAPTSAEVGRRLGKTSSCATRHKNRLVGQGVIKEGPDGALSFQIPLMADYVSQLAE